MNRTRPLSGADVTVRPFQREDIAPLVKYWTGSSEEFWRLRGVDKSKLKSPADFTAAYEKIFLEKGGVPTLVTILFRGLPVGVHALTDLISGDSAVFHAHIWQEEHRRLGICVFSYLRAAEYFFNALNLKKIIFKTPKLNPGPNRVKEKIGIPVKGATVFESPILIGPLDANLYELDRGLLKELKAKHGL